MEPMKNCPNCGSPLGSFQGIQHGCMEGDFEIMYGRDICPICKEGCYAWRFDNSPGNQGMYQGKCCSCEMIQKNG